MQNMEGFHFLHLLNVFCFPKKSAGNSGQQSLQKRLLREALEEDESVFQYDEVYDSMQEAKAAQQAVKDPSLKKVRICCPFLFQ